MGPLDKLALRSSFETLVGQFKLADEAMHNV